MSNIMLTLNVMENIMELSIFLKFDCREGFHKPPFVYDLKSRSARLDFLLPPLLSSASRLL